MGDSIDAGDLVGEVRSLVEDYIKPEVITVTEPGTGQEALAILKGDEVLALPSGLFEPYRFAPRQRHGVATMLSLDSLITHVNRFKDGDSIVFADDDRTKPSITAVLDYHFAGAPGVAPTRSGKHRSTFAFPLSDEWIAWRKSDKEAMSMADFAAFLEERLPDVLALIPNEDELSEDIGKMVDALGGADIIASPTKLMELSRGLQVNENAVVQQAVNLSSGEGVVRFEASHSDATGAPLKVPKVFLIGIPVFRNGWLYRIAARLRYRAGGGKIVFWYELWRLDRTFDHAFNEACERVKAETELPLLLGKPEA